MSPGELNTSVEELMAKMASLVWLSVAGSMSVMAILVHPERAKAVATAAPIPVQDQIDTLRSKQINSNLPVPPVPVTTATLRRCLANDAMLTIVMMTKTAILRRNSLALSWVGWRVLG